MGLKGKGPLAYENWKLWSHDQSQESITLEYPFYTDVDIPMSPVTRFGPYELCSLPCGSSKRFVPRVVLRSTILESVTSLDENRRSMQKTDATRYHGGYIDDEISALISLSVGIRIKPGLPSRVFDKTSDQRGRPLGSGEVEIPHLSSFLHEGIVPGLTRVRTPYDLILMGSFPKLSANQATILVMAARLYQDAMWIVESQPRMSWVLLVSAVETVASYWHKGKFSKLERLRLFKPELVDRLMADSGEELAQFVASQIVDVLGATKKFCAFLLAFNPGPPNSRPIESHQVLWSSDDLCTSLEKIYDWRSKALHTGIAFPSPMCRPPLQVDGGVAETPIGAGNLEHTASATWSGGDCPMHLHMFEYLVRRSLLSWWESLLMAKGSKPTTPATPRAG